jgi:hypothetical protein
MEQLAAPDHFSIKNVSERSVRNKGEYMKKAFSLFLGSAARRSLMAAGILVLIASANPAVAGTHFGVRCQPDFQNGWLPSVDVNSACNDFISEIQMDYPVDFYFNLHGARLAFYSGQSVETCDGCGGADSVDFFFMMTHGGIDNTDSNIAGFAMWDDACPGTKSPGCFAWTSAMRFGSAGKQLKVLATFSCDTLKNDDGKLPNRWGSPFAGGLKLVVGSHHLLWDSNDSQATNLFAADIINGGVSIGSAWLNSLYYENNSNQPTVANTGANSTDCWNRQGITMNKLDSTPVLRDGAIGYYCWTNWN